MKIRNARFLYQNKITISNYISFNLLRTSPHIKKSWNFIFFEGKVRKFFKRLKVYKKEGEPLLHFWLFHFIMETLSKPLFTVKFT